MSSSEAATNTFTATVLCDSPEAMGLPVSVLLLHQEHPGSSWIRLASRPARVGVECELDYHASKAATHVGIQAEYLFLDRPVSIPEGDDSLTITADLGGVLEVAVHEDLVGSSGEYRVIAHRAASDSVLTALERGDFFTASGTVLRRIPGLAPGNYQVLLKSSGQTSHHPRFAIVQPGHTVRVNLTRSDSPWVQGRVTQGGVPLAGAEVAFSSILGTESGPHAGRATSKASGDYDLLVASPGKYLPHVGAWDGSLSWVGPPVQVDEGENRIDLEVAGYSVAGRLWDSESRPVSGRAIQLDIDLAHASDARVLALQTTSRTNSDEFGRFAWHGLPPGVYWVQAGHGQGSGPMVRCEIGPATPRADLRLELSPGGSLRGTVANAPGSNDCRVYFRDMESLQWRYATSVRSGEFSIQHLAPGLYEVAAWDKARGWVSSGPPLYASVSSGNSTEVDLEMEPSARVSVLAFALDRTIPVRIQILDESGLLLPSYHGNRSLRERQFHNGLRVGSSYLIRGHDGLGRSAEALFRPVSSGETFDVTLDF